MQAIISKFLSSAWLGGQGRPLRRISRNARDLEFTKETVSLWGKPACVAGLESNWPAVDLPKRPKKIPHRALIKRVSRRELQQYGSKLLFKTGNLIEELSQCITAVQ